MKEQVYVLIYTSSETLIDGNLDRVDQAFHNTVGAEGCHQVASFGEGFGIGVLGSTTRWTHAVKLLRGYRALPYSKPERAQSYQYSITFELFDGMGLEPLLVDLHRSTACIENFRR